MKFILLFLLILLPLPVFAHQLVTDGSIGVVLHVDPDDDPIANQNATFHFDFQDRENKFQLDHCQCTVVVMQDGKELASAPLTPATLSIASYSYTFLAKGVYAIEVIGVPQPGDAFQPFTVRYSQRVARDGTASGFPAWAWVPIGAGIAVVLVVGFTLALPKRKPARQKDNRQ